MTPAELIAKLEEAKEGSRELDQRIYAELDGRDVIEKDGQLLGRSRTPPHDTCVLRDFWEGTEKFSVPHYTTNLQDALTLVPEGMSWEAGFDDPKFMAREHPYEFELWPRTRDPVNPKTPRFIGNAPTPALALTIAALKARQATEDA